MVNGAGAFKFAPAAIGEGVYFLNRCAGTDNAYYRFSGDSLGTLFDVNSGEIDFYLVSRMSYATRLAQGMGPFRTVFGVEDTPQHFLFSFLILPGCFAYRLGATAADYFYLPKGQEDLLFGEGVTLKVKLRWDGVYRYLYLNERLVQKTTYSKAAANWSAGSMFVLGGADAGYGVYNSSDDVINGFTVLP